MILEPAVVVVVGCGPVCGEDLTENKILAQNLAVGGMAGIEHFVAVANMASEAAAAADAREVDSFPGEWGGVLVLAIHNQTGESWWEFRNVHLSYGLHRLVGLHQMAMW